MLPSHNHRFSSRCSFCSSIHHNILNCNDPRTHEIERTLYRNGVDLLITGNKLQFIRYFNSEIPLKWVKLFACRLNIRSYDNRTNIIENIYTKLLNSAAYRSELASRSARYTLSSSDSHATQNLHSNNIPLSLLADVSTRRLEIPFSNQLNNSIASISTPRVQYSNYVQNNIAQYQSPIPSTPRVQPPEINRERNVNPRQLLSEIQATINQITGLLAQPNNIHSNGLSRFQTVRPSNFKPTYTIINKKTEEHKNNPVECPICYTDIEYTEYVKTTCNHEYCLLCINGIYKTAISSCKDNMTCAICRNDITEVKTYTRIPTLFEVNKN